MHTMSQRDTSDHRITVRVDDSGMRHMLLRLLQRLLPLFFVVVHLPYTTFVISNNVSNMTDWLSKKLKEEFPDSPAAECVRFAQAAERTFEYSKKRNKNELMQESAIQSLEHYHDWRSCYGIDFDKAPVDDDAAIWEWAVEKAMKAERAKEETQRQLVEAQKSKDEDEEPALVDYDSFIDDAVQEEEKDMKESGEVESPQTPAGEECFADIDKPKSTLPQIIFKRRDPKTGDYVRNKQGDIMFHVLPARIDRFAANNESWSLAISLYLDGHFDRQSNDLFSLFIDARAGEGWANPKFLMAMSLTRSIIHSVSTIHPGRWRSVILFPLPRALTGLWRTVKGYFHPEVASIIELVSGPSHLGSRLPKGFLLPFVEEDTLDFLERCRTELYDTTVDDEL
jgi:hypothetical protein